MNRFDMAGEQISPRGLGTLVWLKDWEAIAAKLAEEGNGRKNICAD